MEKILDKRPHPLRANQSVPFLISLVIHDNSDFYHFLVEMGMPGSFLCFERDPHAPAKWENRFLTGMVPGKVSFSPLRDAVEWEYFEK
jgi:hypothetical protein